MIDLGLSADLVEPDLPLVVKSLERLPDQRGRSSMIWMEFKNGRNKNGLWANGLYQLRDLSFKKITFIYVAILNAPKDKIFDAQDRGRLLGLRLPLFWVTSG